MLKKSIVISAAALAFGTIGVFANGCSSSSTTPDTTTNTDSGTVKKDSGTTVNPDGSTSGGDPACFDASSVLSFTTAPLPPAANQGKCASDDLINQFLTACITQGDAGTSDSGEDACTAYLQANQGCSLCLGGFAAADAGTLPASPWPALLQIDTAGHVVPNVAACVAAISTGTDTCKSNYANDDLCVESGCGACSQTDFSDCATAESTDATTTCLAANPLDAACQAALSAVSQTDADSKCGASTTIATDTDFDNVFLEIGKTMCE